MCRPMLSKGQKARPGRLLGQDLAGYPGVGEPGMLDTVMARQLGRPCRSSRKRSMADKRYKAREPKGRQGVGSLCSTHEAGQCLQREGGATMSSLPEKHMPYTERESTTYGNGTGEDNRYSQG